MLIRRLQIYPLEAAQGKASLGLGRAADGRKGQELGGEGGQRRPK